MSDPICVRCNQDHNAESERDQLRAELDRSKAEQEHLADVIEQTQQLEQRALESLKTAIETARQGEAIRRARIEEAESLLLSWLDGGGAYEATENFLAQSAGQGMGLERPLLRGPGEQTPASNRGVVEGAGATASAGAGRSADTQACPAPNATDNGLLAPVWEMIRKLEAQANEHRIMLGNDTAQLDDHESRLKSLGEQLNSHAAKFNAHLRIEHPLRQPAPQPPEARTHEPNCAIDTDHSGRCMAWAKDDGTRAGLKPEAANARCSRGHCQCGTCILDKPGNGFTKDPAYSIAPPPITKPEAPKGGHAFVSDGKKRCDHHEGGEKCGLPKWEAIHANPAKGTR